MRKKTTIPPTFKEELIKIGMSEKSMSDLTFSYADHQFMVRLLNTRDKAVADEVIDVVLEKVAEHNAPLYTKLEELETGQKDIIKLISGFDNRLSTVELKTSWWIGLILGVSLVATTVAMSISIMLEIHSKLP